MTELKPQTVEKCPLPPITPAMRLKKWLRHEGVSLRRHPLSYLVRTLCRLAVAVTVFWKVVWIRPSSAITLSSPSA